MTLSAKRNTAAFTLLELLIVILVVAVLAALAIPQMQSFVNRARGAEAMTILRAVSDSIWRYYLQHGQFPAFAPHSGIPACFDVTLPGSESKYFIYRYEGGVGGCTLSAIDKNVGSDGPAGLIFEYMIYYDGRPVMQYPGFTMKGEKMDAHWYRYRYHLVTLGGGMPQMKPGWPGAEQN